jgi:hypothetical protein
MLVEGTAAAAAQPVLRDAMHQMFCLVPSQGRPYKDHKRAGKRILKQNCSGDM